VSHDLSKMVKVTKKPWHTQTKETRLYLRVSPELKKKMVRAAKAEGKTLSVFILESVQADMAYRAFCKAAERKKR
jgi:uncharacterized protein (DUF1778 family)